MQSGWFGRLFFAIVAALAVGGIFGGTACTRWGQPGPAPPTFAPLSNIYVDAVSGSDTAGNGSLTKPYKTLTKAVDVLVSAKVLGQNGVTIHLANGHYNAANGELFPIVLPKNVTLKGASYGGGPASGVFIDGAGEDTIFEQVVHAAPHSAFTTLEAVPPAIVGLSDIYVGATHVSLKGSRSFYASVDTLTTLNASDSSFGVGKALSIRNVDGILVTGGALSCTSCQIRGNSFGIGALSVSVGTTSPSPSSTPYGTGPSITLARGDTDSTIGAKVIDIVTDGSVSVTVSNETFESGRLAFSDSLTPVVQFPYPGAVDFGGGAAQSSGGNVFIGARETEIGIKRRSETVFALDDTWNPGEQGASRHGNYPHKVVFKAGAAGRNVTVVHGATGSTVTVGPAPVPTPSTSPSTSPTASPT